MLQIVEHFKYYQREVNHTEKLKNDLPGVFSDEVLIAPDHLLFKNDEKRVCLSISMSGGEVFIENSYYVGLAWLNPWKAAVHVSPKVNTANAKLNHIRMLTEALKEPENLKHLDGLMDIRFEEDWIEVDGSSEIQLTPFLIAQFLMCLRSIVCKGLKKDYYRVTENLQSRIKGKILVSQQIRQNVVRHRLTNTVCSYQEYGIDTVSNRFLKYVLHFVQAQVHQFKDEELKNVLLEPLAYCQGAFQQVSEEKFYTFKNQEHNPMYRDYKVATDLGNQILKLMDHNLSKTSQTMRAYPPHWIDMSKLFELYVFKKLREKFTGSGEVQYHTKVNKQELDFIIHSGEFKAVVDAKYKPRYSSQSISIEDARQLSGYARLNRVYTELGVRENELIPVYVIYPKELQDGILAEQIVKEEAEEFDTIDKPKISGQTGQTLFGDNEEVRKSKSYREMYMQEIEMNKFS